jgi:hypothetical protein
MYRRPKFLEVLLEIRQEMAREADYDVDLFAELVRAGRKGAPLHAMAPESDSTRNSKRSRVRPPKTKP